MEKDATKSMQQKRCSKKDTEGKGATKKIHPVRKKLMLDVIWTKIALHLHPQQKSL